MSRHLSRQDNDLEAVFLQVACQAVVQEGAELGEAMRLASTRTRLSRERAPTEADVEAAVRSDLELFQGERQAEELLTLRRLALRWMERLADFRPHLSGAVWRGLATRRHAIWIGLYTDDPKSPEIWMSNERVDYEGSQWPGRQGRTLPLILIDHPMPAWSTYVPIRLVVHDLDDLRGALLPDREGRSPRGDLGAVRSLLDAQAGSAHDR